MLIFRSVLRYLRIFEERHRTDIVIRRTVARELQ